VKHLLDVSSAEARFGVCCCCCREQRADPSDKASKHGEKHPHLGLKRHS